MEEFSLKKQDALEIDNLIEKKRAEFFSGKNNNHRCMYYDCNKKAINSHAISQEISLRFIAVDGNMKCFKSNRNIKLDNGKTLICTKEGISDASSFKGFCCDHDKIFNELDNTSIKATEKDILYQVYRSICFSVYKTSFNEIQNELYYHFIKDKGYYEVMANLVKKDIEFDLQYKDRILHVNAIENILDELISKHISDQKTEHDILCEYKRVIENELLSNNYSNIIKTKDCIETTCDILCIFYKRIDIKIPVAMLNHHLLNINDYVNILLFTVVPYEDSTEIYWIFNKKSYTVMKKKWDIMINKYIHILNQIESSMMHCENWYTHPNIINSMPEQKFNYIRDDIYFNTERSPFDEYDVSIFDDLRKEFLENEDNSIIVKELKKLSYNIKRNDYIERLNEYNKTIFEGI